MSKTWKEQPRARTEETPQKAIDRLRMNEAQRDIKEAREAQYAATK